MDAVKTFRVTGIVEEGQAFETVRVDMVEIAIDDDGATYRGTRLSQSGVPAAGAPPFGAVVEVPLVWPGGAS